MDTDQTATKLGGAFYSRFIVFVIKATKVRKQMKGQITNVTNGVVKRCQVPFRGDVYLLVSYPVHHRQAGLVSELQQGVPT